MKFLQRMAGIVLEALFPAICCQCGRLYIIERNLDPDPTDAPLPTRFSRMMISHFCAACRQQFHSLDSPFCLQCGRPFESPVGPDHICGQCIAHPPRFTAARAAGLYQGALRAAIHHLKYQGRDILAKPLGRLLWQTLCIHWDPSEIDYVVPVPLHARRLRQRGFNQALALIRQWSGQAVRQGVGIGPAWVNPTLLRRHRFTHPQTGLKKEERSVNLRNAFSMVHPGSVHDKIILLVDDVLTTGATANACARVLLNSGAAEVRVLTLARAVV